MTFIRSNNQQTTVSGVWASSLVDYTRLKVNVLDLSSLSTSKLLDLQTNGSSVFSVRKDGAVTSTSSLTVPVLSATTYLNLSASIDDIYVNQSGDTMTGSLTITQPSSLLRLNSTTANVPSILQLSSNITGTNVVGGKIDFNVTGGITYASIQAIQGASTDYGSLAFFARNAGVNSEKLRILADGSISLGGINANNGVAHGFIKDNGLVLVGNNSAANNNKTTTYNAIVRTDGFWVNQSLPIGWIEPNAYSTDTTLRRVAPGVISATNAITTNTLSAITLFVPRVGVDTGGTITPNEQYRSLTFSALTAGSHVGFTNMGLELSYANTAYSILYFGNQSSDNTPTLRYDDVQTLAQRKGTAAQTFRIYNTHTSPTIFERANLTWGSNTFTISTEAGTGGGSGRTIAVSSAAALQLRSNATGGSPVDINSRLYVTNSLAYLQAGITKLNLNSNAILGWAPTGDASFDTDSQIRRISAGLLEVSSTLRATSALVAPTVSATTYLNLSASIDAQYVNQTGDTMTGSLTAPELIVSQGNFTSTGDAQRRFLVMRGLTKNGTPTQLFVDGSSVRATIPSNTRWNAFVRIVASTDSFENRYATFDRKFLIVKADTNASTQIIGPVQNQGMDTGSLDGSPPVGWDVTVSADPTNGSLAIFGTGEVGTYVRWVAEVNLVQVSYEGNLAERTESLFANGEEGVWFDASGFDPAWRRNLLTSTEEFSTWTPLNTSVSSDVSISPNNTFNSDRITTTTSTGNRYIQRAAPTLLFVGGYVYTYSIFVNPQTVSSVNVRMLAGVDVNTRFNLVSRTVESGSGFIEQFNNNFLRLSVSGIPTTTSMTLYLYINDSTTGAFLDVWGSQLEYGPSATPYQRITTVENTFKSDIQRLPTLYQDTQGNTPVTNVEQTVGMILDKSKSFERGPELAISDYTQWASSTNFIRTTTGLSAINAVQFESVQLLNVPYVQNAWYEVTFDVTIVTGIASVQLGHSGQSPSITDYTGQSFRKTLILYYLTTNGNRITIRAETAGATFYVNYLSIRQLKGSHATQEISANRPTLKARYNLLTYSEQFDNAAWGKSNGTVTANNQIDPLGTSTADTFLATANDARISRFDVSTIAGNNYTFSLWIKRLNGTGAVRFYSAGTAGGFSPDIPVTSEWQRHSWSFSPTATQNDLRIIHLSTSGDSVAIWGAQIDFGSSATRYQRIGFANDYDTSGFLPYFSFDGDNDFLSTNTVSLSSTNKLHIAAGVTTFGFKNTATNRNLISFGNILAAGASAGSFSIAYDSGVPYPIVPRIAGSISGISYYPDSSSLSISPAPKTMVYTQLFDMAQTSVSSEYNMRINGTPVISTTYGGTDSAGTFGSYPINIGHRNSGAWLYGNLYSLIVRGTSTNNTLIPIIERYVAQQTGVTI